MYSFKPKKASSRAKLSSSVSSKDKKYIRQIILFNLYSLIVVVVAFFAFVLIFSNINNLWGIFKSKDIYQEQDVSTVGRPFLQTESLYTNKEKIDIAVKAQSGYKVKLFKNGAETTEGIASSENTLDFRDVDISQEDGSKTEFYAISYDNNKESEKSNVLIVTFDKTKPQFEITSPKNGEKVKSFIKNVTVKGKTEEGTTVLVNDTIARVDENNEFSATIKTEEGDFVIKVKVTDKAGNESIQEIKINFDKQEVG